VSLTDDDQLLRTYCPIVYLQSGETSMPSSVQWMLENTDLYDSSDNRVLSPVGSVENLMAEAGATKDWYLALRDEGDRNGQGPDAPFYGTVRPITVNGQIVGYDLLYWFFYPFNGNIFDRDKAIAILSGVVAAGSVAAYLFPPYGYVALAPAIAALSFVSSITGIEMHESDWEHVAVRITASGGILGVYYAAHDGGVWCFQEAPFGSNLSNCYQLEGRRPFVYSAVQSHASYPRQGTVDRLGGFANDYSDTGYRWDVLDSATSRNPMGRLVNMGHDIQNPPQGAEWIQWPGMWGKKGNGAYQFLEWFGQDLGEYADGKPGPAQRNTWYNGDSDGPTSWSNTPVPIPLLAPCNGTFAMAQFQSFLVAVYEQPSNQVSCAIFNGSSWTQPAVPGLSLLGDNSALCLTEYAGALHTFIRVSADLKWAILVIGDDGHTKGWAFQPFNGGLQNPPADGDLACVAYDQNLVLVFSRKNAAGVPGLVHYAYDGQTWTDLTDLYPVFKQWSIDGPITLARYAGVLYMAYGSGGAVRLASFTQGTGWLDLTNNSPPRTYATDISLSTFGGYLFLVYGVAGGGVRWSRCAANLEWLQDADGSDFAVNGASIAGQFGVAPFAAGSYLSLVFPANTPTQGALCQIDILGG